MIDIYMNGAEVHAETPEEEREASLILNATLSGKTDPGGRMHLSGSKGFHGR